MIPVNITFYGDVGFDRSYQHVIDFETEEQREGYFNEKAVVLVTNCAYNKTNNVMRVELPLSECQQFTYCSFNIGEKTYYCWVDGCDLVNDLTTEISITIDPWQTFLFQFSIGESFITRQHYDRWDISDGVKTTKIVNSEHPNTLYLNNRVEMLQDGVNWLVVSYVVTVNNLETIRTVMFPIIASSSGSLYYPYFRINYGSTVTWYASIPLVYVADGSFCSKLGIDPQSVVSASVTPLSMFEVSVSQPGEADYPEEPHTLGIYYRIGNVSSSISAFPFGDYHGIIIDAYDYPSQPMQKFLEVDVQTVRLPNDGDAPRMDAEPQVYKEPYFERCITDEAGNVMGKFSDVFMPYRVGSGFFIYGLYVTMMLDASNPYVMLSFLDPITEENTQRTLGGAYTEGQTINVPLGFINVPSDNWLTYALTQRETDRAMVGSTINQRGIQNAITSIVSTAGISGMVSAGTKGGFVKGALTGGAVGVVGSVANYIVDNHYSWEQQDIKERGIQNSTNNIFSAGSSVAQILNGVSKFNYVERVASDEVRNRAWQNFHKYGYPFATTGTPNLKSRKYWNYIETTQCKINGALTNDIKNEIAEIFNNGVTIWHGDNIDDLTGIGDYTTYENIERSLI